MITTTVLVLRMAHRIWKETKQERGTVGPGNMLGCCLISLHFLWAILSTSTVQGWEIESRGLSRLARNSTAFLRPPLSLSLSLYPPVPRFEPEEVGARARRANELSVSSPLSALSPCLSLTHYLSFRAFKLNSIELDRGRLERTLVSA